VSATKKNHDEQLARAKAGEDVSTQSVVDAVREALGDQPLTDLSGVFASLQGTLPREEVLTFSIPTSVLSEAVGAALRDTLRVDDEFRSWARQQVAKFVRELAPESEHFQSIKDEVAKHLERYPAIGSDPAMQDAIASAILGTMVKPVR
jgi:hypothetical protein